MSKNVFIITLALLFSLCASAQQQEEVQALRTKAASIEADAKAQIAEIIRAAETQANELRDKADLLEKHADKLTPEAKEALEEDARQAKEDNDVAAEEATDAALTARAEVALQQRQAMKARGESIEVPKNVAAMKAILEEQDAAAAAEEAQAK